VINKARLSIRLTAPYSEVRRRKASVLAKEIGFGSQEEKEGINIM